MNILEVGTKTVKTGSEAPENTRQEYVANGKHYYISEHWVPFAQAMTEIPHIQACFYNLNQLGHATIQKMTVLPATLNGFVCRITDQGGSNDVGISWTAIG